MLTQLIFSSVYRGNSFTDNGEWRLCNGQPLLRASYAAFSSVWASGVYGSTGTSIHLPDLNTTYLRMVDLGSSRDTGAQSRTSLSGSFAPVGSGIGSFQAANMAAHVHISGTQLGGTFTETGGECCCNAQTGSSATSTGIELLSSAFVSISGTATTDFDVGSAKVWPYIRVG